MKTALSLALSLLWLATPALSLLAADQSSGAKFKDIGVEEFDKLRAMENVVILDVRTAKEFKAGHIPNAINLDWYKRDFAEQVAKLDKDKVYLVNCAVGGRSAKACQRMEQLNFKTLYNLQGGYKAWDKAGKPTEKPKSRPTEN